MPPHSNQLFVITWKPTTTSLIQSKTFQQKGLKFLIKLSGGSCFTFAWLNYRGTNPLKRNLTDSHCRFNGPPLRIIFPFMFRRSTPRTVFWQCKADWISCHCHHHQFADRIAFGRRIKWFHCVRSGSVPEGTRDNARKGRRTLNKARTLSNNVQSVY